MRVHYYYYYYFIIIVIMSMRSDACKYFINLIILLFVVGLPE